ncbi:MAG: GIY-YIG nuclease family protein [Prosthecochloris sp.]|nr:GIY-YIG nuclease family protein [Prosthecochloris sp.]
MNRRSTGSPPVWICGEEECHEGTYLLLISLQSGARLSFGRFQGGRPIALEAGNYIYTGSAMGSRPGSGPLAARLLRHASRSGNRPAHALRRILLREFRRQELASPATRLPRGKTLRWHIDYLLDHRQVRLAGAVAIRSTERLESHISRFLEALPCSSIPVRGLGAADMPGETHLVRLNDPESCLAALGEQLQKLGVHRSHIFPISALTNFERSKI